MVYMILWFDYNVMDVVDIDFMFYLMIISYPTFVVFYLVIISCNTNHFSLEMMKIFELKTYIYIHMCA